MNDKETTINTISLFNDALSKEIIDNAIPLNAVPDAYQIDRFLLTDIYFIINRLKGELLRK